MFFMAPNLSQWTKLSGCFPTVDDEDAHNFRLVRDFKDPQKKKEIKQKLQLPTEYIAGCHEGHID